MRGQEKRETWPENWSDIINLPHEGSGDSSQTANTVDDRRSTFPMRGQELQNRFGTNLRGRINLPHEGSGASFESQRAPSFRINLPHEGSGV